LVEEVAEK
jgi:hypothetical protein